LKAIKFSNKDVEIFSTLINYQDGKGNVTVFEAIGGKKGNAYSLLSVGITA